MDLIIFCFIITIRRKNKEKFVPLIISWCLCFVKFWGSIFWRPLGRFFKKFQYLHYVCADSWINRRYSTSQCNYPGWYFELISFCIRTSILPCIIYSSRNKRLKIPYFSVSWWCFPFVFCLLSVCRNTFSLSLTISDRINDERKRFSKILSQDLSIRIIKFPSWQVILILNSKKKKISYFPEPNTLVILADVERIGNNSSFLQFFVEGKYSGKKKT